MVFIFAKYYGASLIVGGFGREYYPITALKLGREGHWDQDYGIFVWSGHSTLGRDQTLYIEATVAYRGILPIINIRKPAQPIIYKPPVFVGDVRLIDFEDVGNAAYFFAKLANIAGRYGEYLVQCGRVWLVTDGPEFFDLHKIMNAPGME